MLEYNNKQRQQPSQTVIVINYYILNERLHALIKLYKIELWNGN